MKEIKIKKMNKQRPLFLIMALAMILICPLSARAASLFVDPEELALQPDDIFKVSLMIESTDKAINIISATFDFPANLLEVISVSKNKSMIDLWTTGPSFSNKYGTVDFEGVVLDPGFKGMAGEIITINFKALKEGTAVLQYLYPKVSINGKEGDNLLSETSEVSFSIKERSAEPEMLEVGGNEEEILMATSEESVILENKDEEIFLENSLPAVEVKSSTHPDPEKWYNNNTVEFYWEMPNEADEVRLLANMYATSSPKVEYDYRLASKKIEEVSDGEWFFHIQLGNGVSWGEITHFPFRVDTTPPSGLEVVKASSVGELLISAEDGLSGIDHYEITIDDSSSSIVWYDDGTGIFKLGGLKAGEHLVSVRAFDKASNTSEIEIDIVLEDDLPVQAVFSTAIGEVKAGEEKVIEEKISITDRFRGIKLERFDLGLWQIISIVLSALSLFLFISVMLLRRKLDHCRRVAFKKMKTAEKVLNNVYAIVFNQVNYLETAKKKKSKLTTQETKVLRDLKKALEEVESEYK